MSRTVVIAVLGAAVLAAGVVLALGVREDAPEPEPEPGPPSLQPMTPLPKAVARPSAPVGHTKFVSPPGQEAKPSGDPAQRFPIPEGGFARWTGREGTWPGDIEQYATTAGLSLDVALEQRRSTLLKERTTDTAFLGELLGEPPSGEMLAAIRKHGSVLHDATANLQVQTREGTLGADASVQQTRAAEEAYRRGYLEATGLSEQQFNRFFAPDRPLP